LEINRGSSGYIVFTLLFLFELESSDSYMYTENDMQCCTYCESVSSPKFKRDTLLTGELKLSLLVSLFHDSTSQISKSFFR
jgi:hypothetical protein